MTRIPLLVVALVAALSPATALAQGSPATAAARRAAECPSCAEWNAPERPFRIHGNAWFVGTRGLTAVLITSRDGHVLLDGGLPESAPRIMASIRALGFRVEDVRLIVNSHAHEDHAGGIAELQRASGAAVAASPWSARVLERGRSEPEDPQFAIAIPFPPVPRVRVIADGDTLRVGQLALVAHFTPGHTPGGTSWGWRSCDRDRCLDMVYADSQTPVSADGFSFTRTREYPSVLDDFARGLALLERLPCDVLLTPHPSASRLMERVAAGGRAPRLVDPAGCRRYAANAREQLARRVAAESAR